MKLFAISDLHVGHPKNREAVAAIAAHPDDWCLVAGDIAEREEDILGTLEAFTRKFAKVFWCPGNHELWVMPNETGTSPEKYDRLVEGCRRLGVVTPEDPYLTWPGSSLKIAPLLLLYDYTFHPDTVAPGKANAIRWALEHDILCADEEFVKPGVFGSIEAWCHARVAATHERLVRERPEGPNGGYVLCNHFPLKRDLARLPAVPRFSIWCGTTKTEDWHKEFNAQAVVFGHLHIRRGITVDEVRFHEVSLGYPIQWNGRIAPETFLREIDLG